jgi:acetyl/propionyl-CoA carboxylase alpha subunit
MDFEYLIEGQVRKIALEKKGAIYVVRDGDVVFEADIRRISEHEVMMIVGGRSYPVSLARDGDRTCVFLEGREFVLRPPGEDTGGFHRGEEKALGEGLVVKAPMPGKVIKIPVAEGVEVRKNQTLIIVEAMKMENEIKSAIEGVVKKVFVKVGELVDSEKMLIELELKKE